MMSIAEMADMKNSRLQRIHTEDMVKAKELAAASGESVPQLLHRLIQEEHVRKFLADYDAAYVALRSIPEAWAAHRREVEIFQAAP